MHAVSTRETKLLEENTYLSKEVQVLPGLRREIEVKERERETRSENLFQDLNRSMKEWMNHAEINSK